MTCSVSPLAYTLDLDPTPVSTEREVVVGSALAERLLDQGLLLPMQHEHAVSFCRLRGVRIEDAIIDLGIMSEARLLAYVASIHGARAVLAEELAEARIPRGLRALIPHRLAEARAVLPLLCDEQRRALTVVTADPGDAPMLDEIRRVAGVERVLALVARPAAVSASIALHYRHDGRPFRALLYPHTAPRPRRLSA
jgi:hypothetical protein